MAIYINKAGTKVDEKVVGTKSAEDWSAQGFSVYNPETVAPTESVAPTVAPVNDTVIRADELNTPDNSVVNESAKKGTFATYDPVTGKAVNRRAIEVGQHGQNDYLETPIDGTAYAQNPDQYVITNKDAKTLYGFKKPAQPAEETNVVKGGAGVEDTGTGKTGTGNPVLDELNNWLGSNKSEIEKFSEDLTGQREDVAEQSKYVRGLRAELDSFKNEIDYNKVLQTTNVANTKLDYYNKSDEIKDEPVLASTVNSRLAKLTETTNIALDKEGLAQAVADATNVYKYNSKLIEYNIAAGDLQSAQAMAQQTAQDIKDYKSQMLQIMQFQNQLTMQDYQMKQAEIDREYDMAEKGYTYVENLEALNDLAVKKGTDWVENNTMKIGGKIYIKPEMETVGNWSLETDENGGQFLLDQKTGEIKNLGAVGETGGQCGEYVNDLMGTSFGDSWEDKQSKTNVTPEQFRTSAQVGDILVFKNRLPYGHVAVVSGVDGDKITLTESNWKGDEKIGTRTINAGDPSITGVYRGATLQEAPKFSDTAMAYAKDILAGRMEIANVPGEEMKNETILAKQELEKTEKPLADQLMAQSLQEKIDGFNSVLDHEGMAGTVGAYSFSRWTPFKIDKAEKQEFIGAVEQLIQQETIDKLVQSKAAGATYGALSDGEREMLASAASKIGTWRITDDNGKVTGYEISEEAMKKELQTIRDLAQKARDRILGDSVLLPPGQISDENAYQIYLNTLNQ